ncbi:MAG: hypothetical protein H8E35_08535 [Ardenticatenia bacterium]|nr:hypothetical protein [Ardenticatenia bacterium]
MLYQAFDLLLESNVVLPELRTAQGKEPLILFRLHAARPQDHVTDHWFRHVRLPDGGEWLAVASQQQGFLLRFPGMADFTVSAPGADIDCYPQAGIDWVTLRHLLLDQVIPMVVNQRGELVLHASAVASRDGAIVFLGKTGLGKSTLCASFCQQGFALLTDDCLLLRREGQRFWGLPSYPGLRLWPETRKALSLDSLEFVPVAQYTSKGRIQLHSGRLPFCTGPVPVERLYVLAPSDEGPAIERVRICPMKSSEAFLELVNASFRLDTTDRNRNRRAFEHTDQAVSALAVFRLSFPREISFLPSVREAVLEHLAGGR